MNMTAKTIKGKSPEEIQFVLQQAMADGYTPTLAIVFLSISQDYRAVSRMLDEKGIAVFGASTNGEFVDENVQSGGISILLMDLNPAYFSIYFDEYQDKQYRERASAIARMAKEKFPRPAFLLSCSHTETDAELLLRGLEDVVGEHVNVFGGAAGDDYTFSDQFVFTNDRGSKQGLVVLALNEDMIRVKGRATCGWKAVGTVRTVTKSEGNHVYTVDDIPVLDLTAKYGGIENVSPDNTNLMLEIASTFPLQMQREQSDPVMRPGLLIDWSDHSFYCSGSVPQGCKVRFSLPPDFDVVEKVISSCEDIKAVDMPEADAVVVFSCAGRQVALGPMIQQEVSGIKNVWNAPMAGMFSNAELGRATGGRLEMHNLTTCVVALKENPTQVTGQGAGT
jgi:hypothetical protein